MVSNSMMSIENDSSDMEGDIDAQELVGRILAIFERHASEAQFLNRDEWRKVILLHVNLICIYLFTCHINLLTQTAKILIYLMDMVILRFLQTSFPTLMKTKRTSSFPNQKEMEITQIKWISPKLYPNNINLSIFLLTNQIASL